MRVSKTIVSLIVATSFLACSSAGDGTSTRPGATSGTSSNTTGGLNTTGTGTGSGAGGTSGLITGGDSDAAADNCGHKEFNVMRRPAEVLLLLDRSASMEEDQNGTKGGMPTKWSQITPALTKVIMETNVDVSWGMKVFPEGAAAACDPSTLTPKIDVDVAPMNAAKVTGAIGMTVDSGNGTPTGDAVKQGVAYLQTLKDDNPKYLLLDTDGEPSCPGNGNQSTARPYAVDAVTAAAKAGFHTFVVGVSTSKATASGALNDMAVAGQEARADPNPLATKFYLGNTKDELVTSLKIITGVVSDCTFPLGEAPPVPENIGVRVGTKLAPKDAMHMDGWDYTGPDNMTVKVYGSWCDQIKTTAANTVQMVFACKGEIIN